MPGPDPDGLSIDEHDDRLWLTAHCFADGNPRHRLARMRAIALKMRAGGWTCRACAEPIPLSKRADARYCSERCRKAAARARRRNRLGV